MRRAIENLVVGASAVVAVELAAAAKPQMYADPHDWWSAGNSASISSELESQPAVTAYIGTDRVIDRVLADGPDGLSPRGPRPRRPDERYDGCLRKPRGECADDDK
jgi:hypothetical protein